jgi:hypothetical protein
VKLIKLTVYGGPIFIVLDKITSIQPTSNDSRYGGATGATVKTVCNSAYQVYEPVEKIVRKMKRNEKSS